MEYPNPFQFEGVVTGSNFCDRKEDMEAILEHIKSGNNIILSMKRRVGKTSIIREIFENRLQGSNILCGYVDIYSCTSVKDLYVAIKEGVEDAVGKAISRKITQNRILDAFRGAVVKLTLGTESNIEIDFGGGDYPVLIRKLFIALQELAEKNNFRVVLAIDEFQRIALLEENSVIEANIRTAMQDAQKIAFILSGSNQTMLNAMFQGSRPLYRQGAHYTLKPIDRNTFYRWAKKKFQNKEIDLGKEAFDQIYAFANCEAKIVQHVCFVLFFKCKALTSIDCAMVCDAVASIYKENSEIAALFGNMTLNEQRMIKVIAYANGERVTVSPYISEVGLNHGSVSGLLKKLTSDYRIVKNEAGNYEIVDTELKLWLLAKKRQLCF